MAQPYDGYAEESIANAENVMNEAEAETVARFRQRGCTCRIRVTFVNGQVDDIITSKESDCPLHGEGN